MNPHISRLYGYILKGGYHVASCKLLMTGAYEVILEKLTYDHKAHCYDTERRYCWLWAADKIKDKR